MNPEQWLSLKWNGGSTMSDRWLNQSKIIQVQPITWRQFDWLMSGLEIEQPKAIKPKNPDDEKD